MLPNADGVRARRQRFPEKPPETAPAPTESTLGKWKVSLLSTDWKSYLTKRNIAIAVGIGLVIAAIIYIPPLIASLPAAGTGAQLATVNSGNANPVNQPTIPPIQTPTSREKVKERRHEVHVSPIRGTIQNAFQEAFRLAKFTDVPIIAPSAITCVADKMPTINDMAKFQYPVSAYMNNTSDRSCLFMQLKNVVTEKVSTVALYGRDDSWSFGNLDTGKNVSFLSNDVLKVSELWQGRAVELPSKFPMESAPGQRLYTLYKGAVT